MRLSTKQYQLPFMLVTSLFFLWGFARNILTVLNKHFQDSLHITIAQSAWVEISTFVGYFLMALPAGMLVSRYGYKRGMVLGLCLFAGGALLFIPCTAWGTFGSLLLALFVIACGLAVLEVAANPYVTLLGPVETASSRLNLAQSFNGLGGILAPWLAGQWLLAGGNDDVSLPYACMGIVVLLIALVFARVKLPEQVVEVRQTAVLPESSGWVRYFAFALLALLCYEVAEIGINSYFINYMVGQAWMTGADASTLLSGALILFMLGRLGGSWLMCRVSAARVLSGCAMLSVGCMALVLADVHQWVSIAALMVNYGAEAIMFPTIYSMALQPVPTARVSRAASILMMTPIGGCSFFVMGRIADATSYTLPFILPLVGYAVIVIFALFSAQRKK